MIPMRLMGRLKPKSKTTTKELDPADLSAPPKLICPECNKQLNGLIHKMFFEPFKQFGKATLAMRESVSWATCPYCGKSFLATVFKSNLSRRRYGYGNYDGFKR